MRFRTGAVAAALALVLAIAVAGLSSCTHANPGLAVSPSTKQGRSQAYSAAISELRDYLTAWHEQGASVASQRFLVPDQRGGGGLILRSGKVISYQPYRWVSGNQFTLLVAMDLHFTGSPGAWNVGHNDRFVTFVRTAGRGRYLLRFATGP
jgi:hypothetical protein